jgi:hypothetical protein
MTTPFSKPPPIGKGVYARAQSVDWLSRFDFIAINAARGDAETKATALIAMGKEVWYYLDLTYWMPGQDETVTIAGLEAKILRTGAAGAICDPETGWSEFRWGVTSFPTMRHVELLATSGAWGSPQIYAPTDARLIPRWVSAYGADNVVPSVALWPGHFYVFADSRAYAAYLAALPSTRGSIGWTIDQTSDAYVNAYLAWGQVKSGLTLGPGAASGWGWAVGSVLAGAAALWWGWRKFRR